MLMNNVDPEIAEKPEELVVYGGSGKAARNWECFDAIVRSLQNLENDETLLVQSGKPVGIFRTHPDAPRVLIANSNLVPAWATWEEFWRLEAMGLIMYAARVGARVPRLANFALHTPGVRRLVKKAGGVHPKRQAPRFAAQTFRAWFEQRPRINAGGKPVMLFPDTFTNHFHTDVAQAVCAVLGSFHF